MAATTQDALRELEAVASSLLAAVGDSVVSIGNGGRGSGLVLGPGKVLTNAHNLRDRTTSVTFGDGRVAQGSAAGLDVDGDLAVLDVDTADTPALTWATEPAPAGAIVFALGRGGQRLRLSFGLVAATDASFRGPRGRLVAGSLEHTAPLARGSSGGPLVNRGGQLVGVNTHRLGEGFYAARPTDALLRSRVDELSAGRFVHRPRLGVALAPPEVAARLRRSVGLPEREGLLVRSVEDASPASAAGIAAGDLLVAANGRTLGSVDALHEVLDSLNTEGSTEGSTVPASVVLSVVRGTEEREVTVVLGGAEPA